MESQREMEEWMNRIRDAILSELNSVSSAKELVRVLLRDHLVHS